MQFFDCNIPTRIFLCKTDRSKYSLRLVTGTVILFKFIKINKIQYFNIFQTFPGFESMSIATTRQVEFFIRIQNAILKCNVDSLKLNFQLEKNNKFEKLYFCNHFNRHLGTPFFLHIPKKCLIRLFKFLSYYKINYYPLKHAIHKHLLLFPSHFISTSIAFIMPLLQKKKVKQVITENL